ncbi:hypothetical protein HD553DRAFT_367257 [Filobasidium floriforme]|uniref:uncharacterized protein n=1 Tax=Filobasidium floriforme TaxID=5210 RepID=UPI001E8E1C49|nr:uncharacterized protein HD553DRAFT_367257 [Filobasidium floriforme]KAH8087979.1 hypothetical protein HD553DRAFT_367257 [Filobasidium floriforme]
MSRYLPYWSEPKWFIGESYLLLSSKEMKGLREPKLGEPATSASHYAIMESIMQRLRTHDVQMNCRNVCYFGNYMHLLVEGSQEAKYRLFGLQAFLKVQIRPDRGYQGYSVRAVIIKGVSSHQPSKEKAQSGIKDIYEMIKDTQPLLIKVEPQAEGTIATDSEAGTDTEESVGSDTDTEKTVRPMTRTGRNQVLYRVDYVVAEEDDETIDSLEEALSRALSSSEASVKDISFLDEIALDNGVRNIQKKPTPRPPPLSTIGGVCTDLASKATLGKRTGEKMMADERPPKKAAITSFNRFSGPSPTSIHTADSDRQSIRNEAPDAIASVAAKGGPSQCSLNIRQHHCGEKPAGSDRRLQAERMSEPAGVEANRQGVKETSEGGYGGKSNEAGRAVSSSARDGGVITKLKTTKEKHEAMAKSLEDEADELEAKTAALRRNRFEYRGTEPMTGSRSMTSASSRSLIGIDVNAGPVTP